jgi:hypothetical protein
VWSPEFIEAGQRFLAATSVFTEDFKRGVRCGVLVDHRCHALARFESRRTGDGPGPWGHVEGWDHGLDYSYDWRL